jgi:hypothetical protein
MSGCLNRIHDEKRHSGELFFFRYLDVRIPSRIYVGILQWLTWLVELHVMCAVLSTLILSDIIRVKLCVNRFGVHGLPWPMLVDAPESRLSVQRKNGLDWQPQKLRTARALDAHGPRRTMVDMTCMTCRVLPW